MVSTVVQTSVPTSPKTAILTGPTASGKSALAISLCKKLSHIEIINSDSLLVYRGMNIGTAKPSLEERQGIPHHLVDILDPSTPFNAGEFTRMVNERISEIHERGSRALIVGGTGFYLKALLFGTWNVQLEENRVPETLESLSNETLWNQLLQVDPVSANRIGMNDRYRLLRANQIFRQTGKTPTELQQEMQPHPREDLCLWWIDSSNATLEERIRVRTQTMLRSGLIEEYQEVLTRYGACRPLESIGYFQVKNFLEGRDPAGRKIRAGLLGLEDEICLATRQLVKRQRTWFKNLTAKMPTHSKRFDLPDDLRHFEDAFLATYGGSTRF